MSEYVVNLQWDPEVAVWIAKSDDVSGFVLESGSFDALIERVRYSIPELLELNKKPFDNISLCFLSERRERVS